MQVKRLLKNSPVFPLLISLRYLITRYIKERYYSSCFVSSDNKLDVVEKGGVSFFGYYNISPENQDGELLFLEVKKENIRGSQFEPAFIMLKSKDGSIKKIAETKAWNWQQGCMLQWLPPKNKKIIFNDYNSEKDIYISRIIEKSGKLIQSFDMPINNVSKTGKYALALNYERLAKMRPDYGYFNRKESTLSDNDKDGIWKIDLESGKINLIISLEQLKNVKYSPTMDNAEHKVNHIDINPAGTRFMFLHRWIGAKRRFMRLITADSDGSNLLILNGDIMTSHSCWLNNEEILSFCEVNKERGYFRFKDKTNEVELYSEKFPRVDGHPSISPYGKFVVTDSYPDKSRFSSLFLYNIEKDEIEVIGRFHQPIRFKKEMRIDLHPKWGKDSKSIFFESGHKQNRKLYNMKVSQDNK